MKGQEQYFTQLRAALEQTPGVQNVRTSTRTESILIEHTGPIEAVMQEAEREGYLRLENESEKPYLAQLNRALSASDEKFRHATGGRLDFETLTFVGFLVGGLYQIAKGMVCPPV